MEHSLRRRKFCLLFRCFYDFVKTRRKATAHELSRVKVLGHTKIFSEWILFFEKIIKMKSNVCSQKHHSKQPE